MSTAKKRNVRPSWAEFSQLVDKKVITIRLFKEAAGYMCERELSEPDGTLFTQALPFNTTKEVQQFLHCDPYFSTIKINANKLLGKLALEVPHERPQPIT